MTKGFRIIPVTVDDFGELTELEGSAVYPLPEEYGVLNSSVEHGSEHWSLSINIIKRP